MNKFGNKTVPALGHYIAFDGVHVPMLALLYYKILMLRLNLLFLLRCPAT